MGSLESKRKVMLKELHGRGYFHNKAGTSLEKLKYDDLKAFLALVSAINN
ncbi:hypothetical protein ABC382_00480 [Lysinibacillus sp. 1P01SD]